MVSSDVSQKRQSPQTHLFLSPHFDDAVLSCGGLIADLMRRQEMVIVYTIMAGQPPYRELISPILEEMHQRWGTADDPVAERRRENIKAINSLGALARHGVIPDCVYRYIHRPGDIPIALYPDEDSLFGPVHTADMALMLLESMPLIYANTDVLHVPLGAGHHVDHQLVRDWGQRQARIHPGMSMLYYEDYPHSRDSAVVAQALEYFAPATLEPVLHTLDEAAITAKIAAIRVCSSQVSAFWQDEDDMARSVRADALQTGSGDRSLETGMAEREWRVKD